MSTKRKAKQKYYEKVDILPASNAWSRTKKGKYVLNRNQYNFVGKVEKDTPGVILTVYSSDKNSQIKRKYYDDFSAMTDKLKTKVISYLYEKPVKNGKPQKNTKHKVYLIER